MDVINRIRLFEKQKSHVKQREREETKGKIKYHKMLQEEFEKCCRSIIRPVLLKIQKILEANRYPCRLFDPISALTGELISPRISIELIPDNSIQDLQVLKADYPYKITFGMVWNEPTKIETDMVFENQRPIIFKIDCDVITKEGMAEFMDVFFNKVFPTTK